MVRVLCIGDSHIPNRAKDISVKIYNKINKITEKNLFDYTFFTGDIIEFPELLDYLNIRTKINLFKVMGNMDYHYGNRNAPIYQKLEITMKDNNKITLGLTHGAQISPRGDHSQLENLAIERSYNILISGHTHKEEIHLTNNGILLLNPGSVTGAWSFVASGIPSFIELNINEVSKQIGVDLIQIDKNSKEISISNNKYLFRKNKIIETLI